MEASPTGAVRVDYSMTAGEALPVAVRAQGCRIETDDGRGYLEWSFFNSSGSEANESAMHLAVLYWELLGKPAKIEFLSRVTSYHGSTLGALSLSGSRWRAPFELLLRKYAVVPNSDTAEDGAAALEAAIL